MPWQEKKQRSFIYTLDTITQVHLWRANVNLRCPAWRVLQSLLSRASLCMTLASYLLRILEEEKRQGALMGN